MATSFGLGGHHQAISHKFKSLVPIMKIVNFYGIPFAYIY